MRIGVSSYTFPRLLAAGRMDLDRLLAFARENGCDAVQLCENAPCPPRRELPDGLVVETGLRGIGDELLDHLRLAERTGAGFVRLVLDHGDDRPSPDEAVRRLVPYAEAYRSSGVVLAIENHDRFPARVLRRIVEESGTAVVLDAANSLGCLEGLETVVGELAPFVVNLHLKPVRAVRKPDGLGFDIVGETLSADDSWSGWIARLPNLMSLTLEQWLPEEEEESSARLGVAAMRELRRSELHRRVAGEPLRPEPIPLRFGEVAAELEPDTGWLRDVRFGGTEMIRAVYAAARDSSWGTPRPTIRNLRVHVEADRVVATFEASAAPLVPYHWRARIEVREREIAYEMEGEATAELRTNRVGLLLLHPPRFAGEPCRVGHPDGSTTDGSFPDLIAPHQPFRDVRSLAAPGVTAEFVGDVFETEDQRNWTDASFKTYSRPLDLPYPYALAPGERVSQRIELRFTGPTPPPARIETPSWSPLARVQIGAEPSEHANFAELNRARPADPGAPLSFGVNPQVHAFDWRTILESLEAQRECVRTARAFSRGSLTVGPIRLDGDGSDPRASSLLAAGWTLASAAVMSEAGADALVYDPPEGSPAARVISDLADFAGARIRRRPEPQPLREAVVEIETGSRRAVLAANLTLSSRILGSLPGGRLRRSASTSVQFAGGALSLEPGEYMRLDLEDDGG